MELSPRDWDTPSPQRLAHSAPMRSEILTAHADALTADEDGYDDPSTGLLVFTSRYLASRDCCDLGCRHCPYVD